jgi:hypothetical protein
MLTRMRTSRGTVGVAQCRYGQNYEIACQALTVSRQTRGNVPECGLSLMPHALQMG